MTLYLRIFLLLLVLLNTAILNSGLNYNNTFAQTLLSDPCLEAEVAANKATHFSKTTVYQNAIKAIQAARAENEHCMSFGKDTGGNIIASTLITGNAYSSRSQVIPGRFADIHNHLKELPPSSGDLYGLIDMSAANPNFETRYITTPSGIVYAMAVLQKEKALLFNTLYPRIKSPTWQPAFPEPLVDEFNTLKGWYGASEEMAMAYLLEKYQTGIALFKQDPLGNFQRLNTKETIDVNGRKKYIANNCR